MQDTYEVSEAVQSSVTARKHTCLRVSVQGARMPLGGEPGERKCKRAEDKNLLTVFRSCLLYTSPSPRDGILSRMPSSA